MSRHRYLKDVVTLKLDPQHCTGCRRCTQVCPHAVFEIRERKAVILDRDACMECGACAKNCAAQAITVKPGVGCAGAIIMGALTGNQPSCDQPSPRQPAQTRA
jgi:NAD-dependent dihydropyrimidine dehydrogenase PreA subunit